MIRRLRHSALGACLALALASPAIAQGSRLPAGVEAGLILRRVDGVKRVLLVAAHPDDEDTALLATLARGMGVETAYFAFTRGEGGQNLIGLELGEGLGIVRTGELLAARSIDGASQFFSRAFDFGFSKTAAETFGQWPRDTLLADLVWAIRSFRPQVLISVFSGTPRDGHGQHQAAGQLTLEAWQAAGDPTRFPEQFDEGVEPWTPLKLYRRTYFDPENATLTIETGTLDPLLGRSYYQIAMDARSRHRSQDFGTAQAPGPRESNVLLLDSRVPSGPSDPLFAGVDTTLAGLLREEGESSGALAAYRSAVESARAELRAADPAAIIPSLAEARRNLEILLASPAGAGARRELERRRELIDRVVAAVAGVRLELRSRTEMLVPGQTALVEARVWTGSDASVEVPAPEIRVPAGWRVRPVDPRAAVPEDENGAFGGFFSTREEPRAHGTMVSLHAGELALWRYEVTVPPDAASTSPYYLDRPLDGALYRWPDAPELWTLPFQPPVMEGVARFSVSVGGASSEAEIEWPVRYRGVDKAVGEFWRPIQVVPRVSVAADDGVLIWPVTDNGTRDVGFLLSSLDPEGATGTLELEVPEGWSVDPAEVPFELSGRGSEAPVSFAVTPPRSPAEGDFVLRPIVHAVEGAAQGVLATIIDYPHIEPRLTVTSSAVRAVRLPVRVADRRIGYVMGSGDEGPEAIRQLGLDVEMIEPDDWSADRLDRYDTIVLGVRTYEVRDDLIAANPLLLDWVSRGGTLVVQYNKEEFNDGDYAPFPIEIGRGRVTDENAPVKLLARGAALLHSPNEIHDSDFEGWVQDRGLYYPDRWDGAYTALLGMSDPGEEELDGSLLVAPYGDGLYVHTSLAFFRQLPAGVPGAYRLWANLLSIDARRWREGGTTS